MDYPIMENGKEIGRLHVRQEGLYTVFEAHLPPRAGLTRLYLCGKGESRVLGVMEPGREGRTLCRRLSRRELPTEVQFASTTPDGGQKSTEENLWTAGENGVLYDSERGLIAFPAMLRRGDRRLRLERIGGKEYIVFPW